MTQDFEIENWYVNEVHNHSTTTTSGNYFCTSWKI